MPTATASLTPTITDTPTITPTPDCSEYSMSNFTFANSAVQSLTVTNGDVVDAVAQQIQFDWSYAENYGVTNGYPNLNVDWFSWDGSTSTWVVTEMVYLTHLHLLIGVERLPLMLEVHIFGESTLILIGLAEQHSPMLLAAILV